MRDRIKTALKESMKAGDKEATSTLRLMLTAIAEKDIEARAEDRCEGASEQEILQVLQKMVKQRRESAQTYEDAGRLDLAEQERREIVIIERFMPRQLGEDEMKAAVDQVVGEVGAEGLKDMGKCMGALKAKYAGQMDFAKASTLVKERLG
jgi:hypothetical protein